MRFSWNVKATIMILIMQNNVIYGKWMQIVKHKTKIKHFTKKISWFLLDLTKAQFCEDELQWSQNISYASSFSDIKHTWRLHGVITFSFTFNFDCIVWNQSIVGIDSHQDSSHLCERRVINVIHGHNVTWWTMKPNPHCYIVTWYESLNIYRKRVRQ